MNSQDTLHPNPMINAALTTLTVATGFISVNYQEQLKDIDIILSPIVKACSLASFIFFLIINRKAIKAFFIPNKDESNTNIK